MDINQLKDSIDERITDKTTAGSISPQDVGDSLKDAIDFTKEQLDLKSSTSSPAFTGDPKVPTAPVDDNDDSAASTRFVRAACNAVKRPYQVFTAVISQDGTNAPEIVYELENSLGNIVFTREAIGTYKASLTGAFRFFKTIFFSQSGHARKITVGSITSDDLWFYSYNSSNNAADSLINYDTIEIRVYD